MAEHLGRLLVTLLVVVIGCGESGPSNQSMIPAGGRVSWLQEGVRHNATSADAELKHSSGDDQLVMSAREPGGINIIWSLVSADRVGLGTASCADPGDPIATFIYGEGEDVGFADCSLTVSAIEVAGATRVTGTFEAVYSHPVNPKKVLTEGVFDLQLTVTPRD